MVPSVPHIGGGFGSFSFMFTVVPILVLIVFAIALFSLIKRGTRYLKNSSLPVETLSATVIAKRMDVKHYRNHHRHHEGTMHSHTTSNTFYYITLQFLNGERKEYLDKGGLYGLVIEGDHGYAEVQGEWIVNFKRE